jgi:hypothetical protein
MLARDLQFILSARVHTLYASGPLSTSLKVDRRQEAGKVSHFSGVCYIQEARGVNPAFLTRAVLIWTGVADAGIGGESVLTSGLAYLDRSRRCWHGV